MSKQRFQSAPPNTNTNRFKQSLHNILISKKLNRFTKCLFFCINLLNTIYYRIDYRESLELTVLPFFLWNATSKTIVSNMRTNPSYIKPFII